MLEGGLHGHQPPGVDDGRELRVLLAAGHPAAQHLPLLVPGRVTERDAQHEAVQLGLRQRVRALVLDRVGRGQDVERRVQPVGDALDRDLLLLHGLEQGGLGLRRRPVDLVGEQHVREDRAGAEGEVALALVIEERAGDVG
nr:hypothetical protein GCM10020092_097670 [Actinoplanes digitatis]